MNRYSVWRASGWRGRICDPAVRTAKAGLLEESAGLLEESAGLLKERAGLVKPRARLGHRFEVLLSSYGWCAPRRLTVIPRRRGSSAFPPSPEPRHLSPERRHLSPEPRHLSPEPPSPETGAAVNQASISPRREATGREVEWRIRAGKMDGCRSASFGFG